jgi:hypothetical protein
MLVVMLMLVLAGCAAAVHRWRWGVFAAILMGLLQDPLRKMVPGVPGYLALSTMPIWIATLASGLLSGEVSVRGFLSSFPRFARWVSVFGVYLLIPAALSASYGQNSWLIAALGAVIYTTAFLVLACGWYFPLTRETMIRILKFYAVTASLLLIGGPLDYFGWFGGLAAIGTQAMNMVWVTYRTGEAVFMHSGFFRSPDVMGWHAALVTMIASVLAIRSRGWMRWVWVALSAWGMMNIWICGRRKMIAMLPVFWGVLLLLVCMLRGMKRAILVAGVMFLLLGVAWYGVTRTYRATAIDTYYGSTIGEWDERVMQHGVGAVVTTVRQAGFWGYGLGMGQQGIHHINAEKPRLWQEGGPAKIVAELGVPGAVLLLMLGWVTLVSGYCVIAMCRSSDWFYGYVGLFSILMANMASAVVSSQIFGDPFILLFLVFLVGLLLSGSRKRAESEEGVCPS